jgi:cytoplasmic iron level regulating protein YaaA (DUF328/UPF0246 family)
MLLLLSPSKTLAAKVSPPAELSYSQPEFLKESSELTVILKAMTAEALEKLMEISPKLAQLNQQRYQSFRIPFTPEHATPCLLTFQGDVYEGLNAADFTADDLAYANNHLRILSGLYGLLRPLDLLHPYRLEMGIPLANEHGKDLYAFWGNRVTEAINQAASQSKASAIINLASQEYFRAVKPALLLKPLITVHFKELKGNEYKVIGLFAKRARGMMARFILKERIETPEAMQEFSEAGYQWRPDLSSTADWVFAR